MPLCSWASLTQCFFLRALKTWYASAEQCSRNSMLQCPYFLCMGLSPVLHVTCDPLFLFMASNQRELNKKQSLLQRDLRVALRGSRTASANAVRMPRKHAHYIVLGVKYLQKKNNKKKIRVGCRWVWALIRLFLLFVARQNLKVFSEIFWINLSLENSCSPDVLQPIP